MVMVVVIMIMMMVMVMVMSWSCNDGGDHDDGHGDGYGNGHGDGDGMVMVGVMVSGTVKGACMVVLLYTLVPNDVITSALFVCVPCVPPYTHLNKTHQLSYGIS